MKSNFLFLQLDQGFAELLCDGQVVNTVGFVGRVVSATQSCSHRLGCVPGKLFATQVRGASGCCVLLADPPARNWSECWRNTSVYVIAEGIPSPRVATFGRDSVGVDALCSLTRLMDTPVSV